MKYKPRILSAKIICKTRIFRIEEIELEFANGVTVCYERIKGAAAGAVLVVPMLDAETVLLVREYAAGTDRYELALPKGRIEKGENVMDSANRELMEEVGYRARRLRPLTALTLAPGYIGATTQVVLAQDLYSRRLPGDEPEQIEVIRWDINHLGSLLNRDDFSEARSIAALYVARDLLKQEARGSQE